MNPRARSGESLQQRDKVAGASFLRISVQKRFVIKCVEGVLRVASAFSRGIRNNQGIAADPSRILVIEYWNLGDLVILIPFLRTLRHAFPSARIALLVNWNLKSFLEGQGLVDELIPVRIPWAQHFNRWKKYNPFSPNWFSSVRTVLLLRKRKFDWAFSGRMDIRDNFIMWLVGARRRIGYGVGGGGFLLTDEVMPDPSRPHRAQLWLQLLRHLGIAALNESPKFDLTEAEKRFAADFFQEKGIADADFVIGVHPGARIRTRRWGDQNFAVVAARIQSEFNTRILWFVDPAESRELRDVPASFIQARLPFREFLAVLGRCQMLLCNDSGPMHLATALSVPVVAVFGPMEPRWFGPLGRSKIVIQPDFPCRPCFDYCIYDQPYCLRTISPEQTMKTTVELLRELQAPRCDPSS